MPSKSCEDITGLLSSPNRINSEVHGRPSVQERAFCYITYALLNMLPDVIKNNALYELHTTWSDLNKFQVLVNNFTFPMIFATLPNTIVRALGVE